MINHVAIWEFEVYISLSITDGIINQWLANMEVLFELKNTHFLHRQIYFVMLLFDHQYDRQFWSGVCDVICITYEISTQLKKFPIMMLVASMVWSVIFFCKFVIFSFISFG